MEPKQLVPLRMEALELQRPRCLPPQEALAGLRALGPELPLDRSPDRRLAEKADSKACGLG